MAKNKQGIILIIDNNTTNGTYLTTFCEQLGGPNWETRWLRVCEGELSQDAAMTLPDIKYDVVNSIPEAAKYLDAQLGQMQDVIVFYNTQLGLFQRSASNAENSAITLRLKDFVSQDRRILINLYAVNFSVQKVAAHIDPEFKQRPEHAKVICRHSVSGAPPSKVKKIVEETLEEWEQRIVKRLEESLSR